MENLDISDDLIKRLGPPVEPFERQNNIRNPKRQPLTGETLSFDKEVVSFNSSKEISKQNLITTQAGRYSSETKYLWIIDIKGQLLLILESTPNPTALRKMVCHSNITKGGKALQGGELWFVDERKIALNFKSGRYGAYTLDQEHSVIEYFTLLGFEIQLID
jgi:hypothetical protein